MPRIGTGEDVFFRKSLPKRGSSTSPRRLASWLRNSGPTAWQRRRPRRRISRRSAPGRNARMAARHRRHRSPLAPGPCRRALPGERKCLTLTVAAAFSNPDGRLLAVPIRSTKGRFVRWRLSSADPALSSQGQSARPKASGTWQPAGARPRRFFRRAFASLSQVSPGSIEPKP